jgi:hypothetical protein
MIYIGKNRFCLSGRAFFAGIFLLFVSAGSVSADALNGHDLRLYCTSQSPQDDAICIVYITGAVDAFTTIDLMGQKTSGTTPRFCVPNDVGPEQLKQVMLTWLERPETDLSFAATLLVWGAVSHAYGCPE